MLARGVNLILKDSYVVVYNNKDIEKNLYIAMWFKNEKSEVTDDQ